jgi:hypothetical protein
MLNVAKDWYVLKVRQGFEAAVAQRLGRLNLEVFVSRRKSTSTMESHFNQSDSPRYVHCRFIWDNRLSVTGIPGVLDIIGGSDSVQSMGA